MRAAAALLAVAKHLVGKETAPAAAAAQDELAAGSAPEFLRCRRHCIERIAGGLPERALNMLLSIISALSP